MPPRLCTCLPLGGSTAPGRKAAHKELSSGSQAGPVDFGQAPAARRRRGREEGPLSQTVEEIGVQIPEHGPRSRSTNATGLRLGRCKHKAAGDKSPNGWEKGLLAENQSPDRSPVSVQRSQTTGARNPGFRILQQGARFDCAQKSMSRYLVNSYYVQIVLRL